MKPIEQRAEELIKEWAREEQIDNPEWCGWSNEAIINAFLAGAAAAQEWIPVERELPPLSGWYLVLGGCAEPNVSISFYDNSDWFVCEAVWHMGVTHWMPLPAAPGKGGAELREREK
jgi:hypothetical protein